MLCSEISVYGWKSHFMHRARPTGCIPYTSCGLVGKVELDETELPRYGLRRACRVGSALFDDELHVGALVRVQAICTAAPTDPEKTQEIISDYIGLNSVQSE